MHWITPKLHWILKRQVDIYVSKVKLIYMFYSALRVPNPLNFTLWSGVFELQAFWDQCIEWPWKILKIQCERYARHILIVFLYKANRLKKQDNFDFRGTDHFRQITLNEPKWAWTLQAWSESNKSTPEYQFSVNLLHFTMARGSDNWIFFCFLFATILVLKISNHTFKIIGGSTEAVRKFTFT